MESDEIEVVVRQLGDESAAPAASFFEMLRSLLLAGVGAVTLTRAEIEQFVAQLSERGQIAQKDGERLLSEFRAQRWQGQGGVRLDQFIEARIDQLLGRLNIPSKRDTDELSAKIARLTARVEELRRQEQR